MVITRTGLTITDTCGFGLDTTENLCARWATLGAFSPFYRNHAQNDAADQEFYRWESVAEAARNAIEIRYKLLDYIYTAHYFQHLDGTPLIQPMFFHYPNDVNTFPLGFQYFWGPGLLVAPVTEENSTTATFYLPADTYYDYYTHEKIIGTGSEYTVNEVDFTDIPLYYKGGSILAQRVNSANTTTELRKQDFNIVIAPSANGTASGDLYLDDGDSVEQESYSLIHFDFSADGWLTMSGHFGYNPGVIISQFTVLGRNSTVGGAATGASRIKNVGISLTEQYRGRV